MKEQYIEEISKYVNAQDEQQLKWLAEMTHYIDASKLAYIFTLAKKLFGRR